MGIDVSAARFLLSAKERGVRFDRTVTLGRQDLNATPAEINEVFSAFGRSGEPGVQLTDGGSYLAYLGAEHVDSIDVSPFDRATILHDLNEPIRDELKQKYTLVYDGGTLEHVFNYPCGLRNCMEMVSQGGHLIIFTPANNFFGHGFYQLSPELFFRALAPANGFQIERVVAAEVGGGWYEVIDPVQVKQRVELANDRPLYLMVQAKRIEVVPIFASWPQQSDYAAIWAEYEGENAGSRGQLEFQTRQYLKRYPRIWKVLRRIRWMYNSATENKRRSFDNQKFFRPVDR